MAFHGDYVWWKGSQCGHLQLGRIVSDNGFSQFLPGVGSHAESTMFSATAVNVLKSVDRK